MNTQEFMKRFSKGQVIAGLVLVALMLVFAAFLKTLNPKLAVALFLGLGIGYTLTRSRFGFAGGCASGTLSDLGEGEARSLIAVIFFIFGSIPGHWLRGIIDRGPLGKVGVQHYLPQTFGFFGAFLITALICLGLYYWAKAYQKKRIAEGTYRPIVYDDFEKPLTDADQNKGGMGLYHNLFCTRWSFKTGALVLTVVSADYFVFFKKAWGVTSAFTRMAVWFLGLFGIKFNDPSFASVYEKIEKGILHDNGVILDIGIVFGAMICFLLASRFNFNTKFNMKNAGLFAFGGLLMGFGARLAKGCNIGALYSSVTNFSVAGWLFTIAISLGAVVALKVFSKGRSCLVPPRHRNPADF